MTIIHSPKNTKKIDMVYAILSVDENGMEGICATYVGNMSVQCVSSEKSIINHIYKRVEENTRLSPVNLDFKIVEFVRKEIQLPKDLKTDFILVKRDGFEKNIGHYCKTSVPFFIRYTKMPSMEIRRFESSCTDPSGSGGCEYMEFRYCKTEYETNRVKHVYKELYKEQ
jgi:hypothetical protein